MTQVLRYHPQNSTNHFYCASCQQKCSLTKHIEEAYPGQFVTLFTSNCCDDQVVDWQSLPVPHNLLSRSYDETQSYRI